MIVVAIIGILAAIAVPDFMSMQYKTKRSEVPMNMKAIKTSEEAYKAADNVYVGAAEYPSAPAQNPQQWDVTASGGFKTLGWEPDAGVRGTYAVATTSNTLTLQSLVLLMWTATVLKLHIQRLLQKLLY